MLYLYIVLGIFGLIILVFGLMGLGQPTVAKASAAVQIQQPIATVYKQCASLRNFVVWSPWTSKDPSMKMSFSEEQEVVGAWYKWSGNKKVGVGSMTIQELIPYNKVGITLVFGFRKASLATFELSENDDVTTVVWSFESDMGKNPFQRAMIPMMQKFIAKDFELGLMNLKQTLTANT